MSDTQKTDKLTSAGGAKPIVIGDIINRQAEPNDNGQVQNAQAAQADAGNAEEKKISDVNAVNTGDNSQPADNSSNPNSEDNQQSQASKPLTDEELRAEYEKRFSKPADLTPEQIKATEAAFEKRMLDAYTEIGGKGEDFYTLKQVASMDLTELSKMELTRELTAKGFSPEQIQAIQVERYYQLNPEEVTQAYEETEEEFQARKDFIKKKVEYGQEKFANRSAHIQKNAQETLDTLKETIAEKELLVKKENEFIAKVDEISKTLPRKLTLELGKLNNEDLGSVQVDIPEADIAAITASLKDPVQRRKILYTEAGELNIETITNLLLRNKVLEVAARESLFEGQTRQVAKFKEVFPNRSAHAVGIGGATSSSAREGKSGKITGFGKSQVMNQPYVKTNQ